MISSIQAIHVSRKRYNTHVLKVLLYRGVSVHLKGGGGGLKEVFFYELRNCVKFQRYAKEVKNVEFKQINFNSCFIFSNLNNARYCNGVHLI